ncbi:MAG: hypothetical protein COA94_02380 [Rickettsiales bacterium]|nr:MAG: hypothetical protein COA94_02380 [Rickettsiales bacterium]
MYIVILLLVYILYLFYLTNNGNVKLAKLSHLLNIIINKSKIQKYSYTLSESNVSSFVLNKKDIYVVLQRNGIMYDDNTIIGVLLHEYSHIVCSDLENNGHTDLFNKIESVLITSANDLGVYDSTLGVDDTYPCVK